jgi:hypothetical protein
LDCRRPLEQPVGRAGLEIRLRGVGVKAGAEGEEVREREVRNAGEDDEVEVAAVEEETKTGTLAGDAAGDVDVGTAFAGVDGRQGPAGWFVIDETGLGCRVKGRGSEDSDESENERKRRAIRSPVSKSEGHRLRIVEPDLLEFETERMKHLLRSLGSARNIISLRPKRIRRTSSSPSQSPASTPPNRTSSIEAPC